VLKSDDGKKRFSTVYIMVQKQPQSRHLGMTHSTGIVACSCLALLLPLLLLLMTKKLDKVFNKLIATKINID